MKVISPGDRFGRLEVIELGVRKPCPSTPGGRPAARCICDCGTETIVVLSALRRGDTHSCGCLRREVGHLRVAHLFGATHGFSGHPLWRVWEGMMARCCNPAAIGYRYYGSRGISVYEPWHDVRVFVADIEREIGPRPAERHKSGRLVYTLDRIDNHGDYRPGNVRWATMAEQAQNRRARGTAQAR